MRHVRLGGQHKSCYDTVEVNFSIACEKSSQLCILFVFFLAQLLFSTDVQSWQKSFFPGTEMPPPPPARPNAGQRPTWPRETC